MAVIFLEMVDLIGFEPTTLFPLYNLPRGISRDPERGAVGKNPRKSVRRAGAFLCPDAAADKVQ